MYMLRKLRWNSRYWGLLLCVTVLWLFVPIRSQAITPEKRVLFISSYNYSWDAVQAQIRGMERVFTDGYFLDYEFMDCRKGDIVESRENFWEGFERRLQKIPPYDLILVSGDPALQLILENREEVFSGIPVVFECVNRAELAERAIQDPLITGIREDVDLMKNIELGQTLIPLTNSVVVLVDDTVPGVAIQNRLVTVEADMSDVTFRVINSSKLTERELIYELKLIHKNDVVIFGAMSENAEGQIYTDTEAIRMLGTYCPAPVLRMIDSGLDNGLVGGYVIPMEETGYLAAKMCADILNGRKISTFVCDVGPFQYILNEEVIREFDLDESGIPEEAVIVNHRESIWERYRELFKAMVPLWIILAVVAGYAIFDNLRMRKVMKELKEARQIMENASHHDFLTGLPNRSKFVADLQEVIRDKQPCSVIMLDIDDFKHINDTMGHGAGDDALKQIAARMKAMQSNILMPYRYAGDEFIFILKSAQPNLVEKTAYGCRQIFAGKVTLVGEKKVITGSIGIASYPKDAEDLEKLIACADAAMYEVKKSGKNKFAYYKAPADV